MFARFAAVSLVAVTVLSCERVTPTSPPIGLQPSLAASSIKLTASATGSVQQVDLADRGDENGAIGEGRREGGHTFNVTFTKWVTDWPNMAGIVGGDVGAGTFAGEVLAFAPGAVITNIEALYHIHGGIHSFTAHNFVTQNEVTRTAVVAGVVTDGWLKGRKVNGSYNIISCPDKTGGLCYQGTLHIRTASER